MNRLLATLAALLPPGAFAHEGHGAGPVHLHPGEALGLAVIAGVLAIAIARLWRK